MKIDTFELALRAMAPAPRMGMRAALLEGPPGCGKTWRTQEASRRLGATYVYALLHSWSDDQELYCGIDVAAAVAGDASEVRQPGVLAVAAEASQRGPVVLCLDEVDKVQESTEGLLLDFLQTGRVPIQPGRHLEARRESMWVFLTSNATRPLSDALLRRVRRVRMTSLPRDVMISLAVEETCVAKGVASLAYKALAAAAEADKAPLSLQEFVAFLQDLQVAESALEVREYLRQWVRGSAGVDAVNRSRLHEAIWGELKRRTTR